MQTISTDRVKSVSEITAEIKGLLENTYRFITVSGEISNLRIPYSGHNYFTLKDSKAQIRSVLFKGNIRFLSDSLADGQHVICRGRISVYEPRGEYQLIVDTVEQYGEGLLQRQFAALKNKLSQEGLFDSENKKEIPPYPQKIVVITSPTGAAIHDFLKVCKLRKTSAKIMVFPVAVQGAGASSEIAGAIATVNKKVDCDLIVLCRGGGSLEDLQPFNEEEVARAVYHSAIPVVSGVGHETDHTITDFCADLRAPTPTGAAEMTVPDTRRLVLSVDNSLKILQRLFQFKLLRLDRELVHQKRLLVNFGQKIETNSYRLDLAVDRFQQAAQTYHNELTQEIDKLLARLSSQAPLNKFSMQQQTVQYLRNQLVQQVQTLLRRQEDTLSKHAALLQSVSPLSTLARGYSVVRLLEMTGKEGNVVTNSDQVNTGDKVSVLLNQGNLTCEVQEKDS